MTNMVGSNFGTPAAESDREIALTIDGLEVMVPVGVSVLRAAAVAGLTIPRLCATESLEPFGSCRVCLVEIEGRRGSPASCTTPAEPGMSVRTQTPHLQRLRRGVLELYVSDHPLDCLTCPANGDCELQDVAGEVGLREVRYGVDGHHHLDAPSDDTNPYFSFDGSKCIACSRCVRACAEIQGTFALTVQGRGFDSAISPGGVTFLDSECVSCGACVQACPTATLEEKAVIQLGVPTRIVKTTCAYCGVGCSFRAELRGDELVRMVPDRDGGANAGHSCVKGRFAWGYATHRDRILTPLVRDHIGDPWRETTWEEAIAQAAARLLRVRDEYGPQSIGGITSSRCTNEEVYAVQKMIRAAFGNNNVDTCARVCHSPTGYGLSQAFGTSAGTQDFRSVDQADVIVVIGANPTDAHPVFGARIKRRIRDGARLIVIDPRRIDLVRSPNVEAALHLQLQPGTNVPIVNSLAHVILTEGLQDDDFIRDRCDPVAFAEWSAFIADPANSPESLEAVTGVPAILVRRAARIYAEGPNSAIYYGLGVTEHSQGSTMVMGMANLAMLTGNIGRPGVGVNPLRGQNNVQGACDMGSFPHELAGYRHVSDDVVRQQFERMWEATLQAEPGLRIPNMFNAALAGHFRGLFIQGEDIAQSDPNTRHVTAALAAMDVVVVQDLFLNETSQFAHIFLPGTSFLEKDGTFTNAERRINRVRPVWASKVGRQEWEVACELSTAMGFPMRYDTAADIMDEISALTPSFANVSFPALDRLGGIQWPCDGESPSGTPVLHTEEFTRGLGKFSITTFIPTTERSTRKYPLLLTTGRVLSQYNVGAQTRRTANTIWHDEDVVDIHEADASPRGIITGSWVEVASRAGSTVLRARVSDRVPPGVVFTTFHYPATGANVVTTDNSDWATNCPEFKVTAVDVGVTTPGESRASPSDLGLQLQEVDHEGLRISIAQMAHAVAVNSTGPAAAVHHLMRYWTAQMRSILVGTASDTSIVLTEQAATLAAQLASATGSEA